MLTTKGKNCLPVEASKSEDGSLRDSRSESKQSDTSRSFDFARLRLTSLRTKYASSRQLRAGPISFSIFEGL